MLKQTLGPKKEAVIGGSWKLHNEEVHYIHSSPNTMRLIKSSTRKWKGLVSHMGGNKMRTKVWLGKLREKEHLEDSGVDGSITLQLILKS